jgi:hypothetical protein
VEPKIKMINDYGCLAVEAGAGFSLLKKIILFYSVPPVGVNPSRDGDTKPRVSKRDSRVTKGGKKNV